MILVLQEQAAMIFVLEQERDGGKTCQFVNEFDMTVGQVQHRLAG